MQTLSQRLQQLGTGTLYSALAGLQLLLIVLLLVVFQPLQSLDNRLGDALLRWHAHSRQPPSDVVLIDIDQPSLVNPDMLAIAGTWSWPRAIHAELIEALAAHQPRAIVLDIILSPADALRPDNDAALAEALDFERAFVPMILLPDSEQQAPLALAPEVMGIRRLPHAQEDARYGIDAPIALPPERWRTGYINFIKEADGIGRMIELGRDVQGWWLPHMVGRVADALNLPKPDQPLWRLHWYGSNFTRIPYAQAYLASQSEGAALPFDPKGKIIVIGSTASGLLDFVPTPLDATTPGPFVLATALANLQAQDWLEEAPTWVNPALALALLAGIALAFARNISPLMAASFYGLVTLLTLGVAASALRWGVYWMPVSALSLGALTLLSFGVVASRLEMAQRRHVQAMFSRFLDPRIVGNLAQRGKSAQVQESTSCDISVLFTDIRGFTALSEHRSPEEVVALLNRHFEILVDVVFRHQGTLDKFIGDAVMAFWGAPIAQAEHPKLAVQAALEMAAAIQQLNAQLQQSLPHAPNLEIGIGVHSGTAVVGFLGTAQRLEYTAVGDTVNLSSRIEGCTKGVAPILVSEATRQACGDAFDFISHGQFHVKGRGQAVTLYEPRAKPI